jgi:hypothetical protein
LERRQILHTGVERKKTAGDGFQQSGAFGSGDTFQKVLQLFYALKLSAERTCYPHLDGAQLDAVYSVPTFWGDERTLARSAHYVHIPAKYGIIIFLLVGGCAVVSEDPMVRSESDSQHARVLRSELLQGNKFSGFETWLVGAVDKLRRGGLPLRTAQRLHGRTLLASFGAWADNAADAAAHRAIVRQLLERLIMRRAAAMYKAWAGSAYVLQRGRRIAHQVAVQMRDRKLSAAWNGWVDETEASAAKYEENLSQPTNVRSLPQCLMRASVPALAR